MVHVASINGHLQPGADGLHDFFRRLGFAKAFANVFALEESSDIGQQARLQPCHGVPCGSA